MGGKLVIYFHTHAHAHTHTHRHTMEYYSAIKKNKIMLFTATWMQIEVVSMQSESQRKINTI